MTPSDSAKALVRRFVESDLNTPDAALTDEIVAPDFFDHTNPPGMQEGRQGHRAIVALFHRAFPGLRFAIEDPMVAEGESVAFRLTMRGVHGGEFFGIPPTGTEVTVGGTHILRLSDGMVAEHWGNNDDLGMMRQLGAVG